MNKFFRHFWPSVHLLAALVVGLVAYSVLGPNPSARAGAEEPVTKLAVAQTVGDVRLADLAIDQEKATKTGPVEPEISVSARESVASAPSQTASQPRHQNAIAIPSIGVKANIISVGLTASGNVDTPSNLSTVGWWNGSPWFGSSGYFATFLVGHSPGVFSGLGGLAIGSQLTVSLEDGQVITYQVVGSELRSLDDPNLMIDALAPRGPAAMNLMTCAGRYDASRGTYDQRWVIYATRI